LETTYTRRVVLLRGGFCVFDVINTIALSAQFVGRNTPAIYSHIFHSCISTPAFSAPPLDLRGLYTSKGRGGVKNERLWYERGRSVSGREEGGLSHPF